MTVVAPPVEVLIASPDRVTKVPLPQDPAVHAPADPNTQSPFTGASPAGELVELEITKSPVAGHVIEPPPPVQPTFVTTAGEPVG